MKLILERDGIKREIESPFVLCISSKDAKRLIELLQTELDRGLTHAWVTIHDIPKVESVPSQAPRPWNDLNGRS